MEIIDPERKFTLEELRVFNGIPKEKNPKAKIYIGVKGVVFDMSSASNFYGPPEGPYCIFAGRDASVALAKTQVNASLLDMPITDLTPEEHNTLNEWFAKYVEKYPQIGKLA